MTREDADWLREPSTSRKHIPGKVTPCSSLPCADCQNLRTMLKSLYVVGKVLSCCLQVLVSTLRSNLTLGFNIALCEWGQVEGEVIGVLDRCSCEAATAPCFCFHHRSLPTCRNDIPRDEEALKPRLTVLVYVRCYVLRRGSRGRGLSLSFGIFMHRDAVGVCVQACNWVVVIIIRSEAQQRAEKECCEIGNWSVIWKTNKMKTGLAPFLLLPCLLLRHPVPGVHCNQYLKEIPLRLYLQEKSSKFSTHEKAVSELPHLVHGRWSEKADGVWEEIVRGRGKRER